MFSQICMIRANVLAEILQPDGHHIPYDETIYIIQFILIFNQDSTKFLHAIKTTHQCHILIRIFFNFFRDFNHFGMII